jgi:hypothetical protein
VAVAQLRLVRSMRPLVGICAMLLLSCATKPSADLAFGDHYPHTRWIDRETHSFRVDAFRDRLVISVQGGPLVTVPGRWMGRGFWPSSEPQRYVPYFGVAHEGVDAGFFGDARLDRYHFKRVRPDPT